VRAVIDAGRCQGHGQCVLTCPELFGADDQGFAVLRQPEIPPALAEKAERAALRCPERAIRIER
jgi:ferredoxin